MGTFIDTFTRDKDFMNEKTRFKILNSEIQKRTGDPFSGVFDWDRERGGVLKAATSFENKGFVKGSTCELGPTAGFDDWVNAILKDFEKFGANRFYSYSCCLPREFGLFALYKGGYS